MDANEIDAIFFNIFRSSQGILHVCIAQLPLIIFSAAAIRLIITKIEFSISYSKTFFHNLHMCLHIQEHFGVDFEQGQFAHLYSFDSNLASLLKMLQS